MLARLQESKKLEQFIHIFLFDAYTCILNLNFKETLIIHDLVLENLSESVVLNWKIKLIFNIPALYRDISSKWCELDSVGNQVEEYLL